MNHKYDETIASDTIQNSTLNADGMAAFNASVISLVIVWHRDASRVGAKAPLFLDRNHSISISRITPNFKEYDGVAEAPLMDRHLSRSPLEITKIAAREFHFKPAKPMDIQVNGRDIGDGITVHMDELGDEIIITIAGTVILSLCDIPARDHGDKHGLIGMSKGVAANRHMIAQVASTAMPVLVQGETGTGKELVAKAIHIASDRAFNKWVAVNMATITPSLAGVELFGARKGAYTGANADVRGLFEEASESTLFLDEVGDTPKEVQPMLLRALEQNEIKRIGDNKIIEIDTRVIAATDRSLEGEEAEISFNQPLLRRLEGFSIFIPPLRMRRLDIGLLLLEFSKSNDVEGPLDHAEPAALSIKMVEQLCLHDWPGNIRELKNAFRRIQIGQSPFSQKSKPQRNNIEQVYARPDQTNKQSLSAPKAKYRDSIEISEADLLAALDECNWVIKDTAQKLNVARSSLYDLIAKSSSIRDASEIPDDEILDATRNVAGGLDAWVKHLRVGRAPLQRRLKTLMK